MASLAAGQHDLVTSLAPQEFDWQSCHPLFGTPLMATVHHAVLLPGGKQEERMHELIRWCMAMGAHSRAVAHRAEGMSVGLPPSPPGPGWKVYDDNGHIWWQYDGMLGLFWCEHSRVITWISLDFFPILKTFGSSGNKLTNTDYTTNTI